MARIYYLSNAVIPGKLAHTVQIMNMCAAFAELGHDVTLFCRVPGEFEEDPFSYYGVDENFRIVPGRPGRIPYLKSLSYYRNMARQVAKMPRPDILYGRNPSAFLFSRHIEAARIVEAHEMLPNLATKLAAYRLYRHPGFRTLVTLNRALQEDILAAYPHPISSACIIAPSGCRDFGDHISAAELPGRCGVGKVGYVGHLYAGKGMEVIAKLPQLLPEVDFHIVGGLEKDIDFWRRKLPAPNVFFHGHVPSHSVPHYVRSFDIVLAPLQRSVTHFNAGQEIGRYTSPLKILEYMSLEVPLIASDIESVRELVKHDKTGLLVDPDKPQAWAAAIHRLLQDKKFAAAMAVQARSEVLDRYTWTRRAKAILDHALCNRRDGI